MNPICRAWRTSLRPFVELRRLSSGATMLMAPPTSLNITGRIGLREGGARGRREDRWNARLPGTEIGEAVGRFKPASDGAGPLRVAESQESRGHDVDAVSGAQHDVVRHAIGDAEPRCEQK